MGRPPPCTVSHVTRLGEVKIPKPPEGCSWMAMPSAPKLCPPRRDVDSDRWLVPLLPTLLPWSSTLHVLLGGAGPGEWHGRLTAPMQRQHHPRPRQTQGRRRYGTPPRLGLGRHWPFFAGAWAGTVTKRRRDTNIKVVLVLLVCDMLYLVAGVCWWPVDMGGFNVNQYKCIEESEPNSMFSFL